MRILIILISGLLVIPCSAPAAGGGQALPAGTSVAYWQSTDDAIQQESYLRTTRHNRRIIRQSVREKLDGIGAYGKAAALLGATVSLATEDQRYDLNDSGSIGLLVRDTADSDRSMLLEYKLAW